MPCSGRSRAPSLQRPAQDSACVAPWRVLPTNLALADRESPKCRWMDAGSFEALVRELPLLLRLARVRAGSPRPPSWDAREPPSSPESGAELGKTGTTGAGIEAACGRRRVGAALGLGGQRGQRRRRRRRPGGRRRCRRCRASTRRWPASSGLHRRVSRSERRRAQYQAGGGEAARGEAGLWLGAPQLGGRALLRLVGVAAPS